MLNQNNNRFLSFTVMVFLIAVLNVFAESKLPVFADSFQTAAFLVENYKPVPAGVWSIADGHLTANAPGAAAAALKQKIPEECEVVVDITLLELKDTYFAGITLHGVNFLITKDGYWNPYKIPGVSHSLGGFANNKIKVNQKYQFRIVCRKVNGAMMFSWFVNDVKVREFIEAGKLKYGGFAFFANKMAATYDNLSISRIVQGEASRNMLFNSSFEYTQDDYPLYWKLGDPTWMLSEYDNIDKFWQTWALEHDKAHVRSGSTSLRLEGNGDALGRSAQSHQASITIGNSVTCSIYIKSNTNDFPVRMRLWETYGKSHVRDFKVGKEWQRCQLVVTNPAINSIRIGVSFKEKGTIWLDDAQVELGETVSKYEPSALDTRFTASNVEKIVFPEKIELSRFKSPPVFDGKIEDTWQGMAKTDKFLIKGKASPADKTEAFLGYDDDNLYLAFRCYCDDTTKLKAVAQEDDSGNIWTDDCVEIFLDPTLSRSRYLHLGINSRGVKAAAAGNERPGTSTWAVKTSLDSGGKYWEAEVKLPLSMLGLTEATGNEWGINLCRNERSRDEQSCTALTPRVNFHDVTYYGSVVWPAEILQKFALDVLDLRFAEAVDADNLVIAGVLRGRSGVDKSVSLQFFADMNPVTEKRQLTLNQDGAVEFAIPCIKGMGKGNTHLLIGKVFSGKGELLKQFEQTARLETRIEAYTQRNYYMNEENAILVVNLNIPIKVNLSGIITVTDKDKKSLWSGQSSAIKRTMRFDVPIRSFPVGSYDILLEVKNGEKVLASANSPLMKRAYVKNGTQIDRERRCIIVDGKPFLVIAPLWHMFSPSREFMEKVARHWVAAGFKTIEVVKNSKHNDFEQCFTNILAACDENGIKTILWPGYDRQKDAKDECERVAAPFIKAPSLIAWLPVDEPDLGSTQDCDRVAACINEFRRCDPYHPTFMNNFSSGIPSRCAHMTDILSIDDYVTNQEDRNVAGVLASLGGIVRIGEKERKPSWMFLSGNNLSNHTREPTIGEQVAQSYGAIIKGCSGIVYFLGQPSGKRHWEILKQINNELLSLNDVIFSLEETVPAVVKASSVISMTRRFDDSFYIISVNLEDKPVDAVVMLPGNFKTQGKVDVLFEGRSIDFKDAQFADVYAPHQRHVYRISTK